MEVRITKRLIRKDSFKNPGSVEQPSFPYSLSFDMEISVFNRKKIT